MVPGAGVEPAWDFSRGILSPLRLPIPPPGQKELFCPEFFAPLPHKRKAKN